MAAEIDGVLIKLVDPGKAEVELYALPVETVTHTITRNPIVFPVPSLNEGTTGQPVIFGLDFGMMSETLSFSGTLSDTDERPNRPNHQELADAVRTWWRYLTTPCGVSGTRNTNKILIKEGGRHGVWVYGGVIQSAQFAREGGKTWWTYKLTFQIITPPTVDSSAVNPSW